MTIDFRRPLTLYERTAAVAVLLPVGLVFVVQSWLLLALQLVLLWHWLSIRWVLRNVDRWSEQRVATRFCLVEWAAAVALTLVEGWAIHVTPIMSLGPVVLAAVAVSPFRHRVLTLSCTAMLAVLTLLSRLTNAGELYQASTVRMRDAIALIFTPTLVALVAYVAWIGQQAIRRRRADVELSRRRLSDADGLARNDLSDSLRELAAEIDAVARDVEINDAAADADLAERTQGLSRRVRGVAQRHNVDTFSLDRSGDAQGLLGHHIELHLGAVPEDRPPVVDAVARSVLADLGHSLVGVDAAVRIGRRDDAAVEIRVEVAAERTPEIGALAVDRVAAIGGWIDQLTVGAVGPITLRIVLPLATEVSKPPRRRTVRSDLIVGALFPLAGTAASFGLWATVLRGSDMLVAALLIAGVYLAPCLVAVALARARPGAALSLFVAAHWVSALVVADQLSIIKFYGPIVLLVPLLVVQPYVSDAVYRGVTVLTCLAVLGLVAVARLGSQIEAADQADEWVAIVIVLIFVPAAGFAVLAISSSNFTTMAAAGVDSALARRRLVESVDVEQRSIERDLHDHVQQRLVTAALRLSVAGRAADAADRETNRQVAMSQLGEAARGVRLLAARRLTIETSGGDLATALGALRASTPLPVALELTGDVSSVPSSTATAVWAGCVEAVANVIKHAGPAEVRIEVHRLPTSISFVVTDNGVGFDDSGAPAGGDRDPFGRPGLISRAEEAGGVVVVRSQPGTGTTVSGSYPIPDTVVALESEPVIWR